MHAGGSLSSREQITLLPAKSTLKDEEKLSHSKLYPSALCSTSKEPRHGRPLSRHLPRCGREAPAECGVLIFFRFSFAHKTGQMPWNSINISENQIIKLPSFLLLEVETSLSAVTGNSLRSSLRVSG